MTRLLPLYLIFALSGFAGLVYESVWSSYLKLFLGHAAYAQSLVLAVYMGGMAVGAALAAKYGGRIKNLIAVYALIEGGLGLFALVFHAEFELITGAAYGVIFPALGGGMAAGIFKWAVAMILIAPQTVLLGMTFPLFSAGLIRRYNLPAGQAVATLYFLNGLGAAAGALAAGFVLTPIGGLPGAIAFAGLVNFVMAVSAFMISRTGEPGTAVEGIGNGPVSTSPDRGTYYFYLAVAFATGLASFVYEIGWIRMLTLVLGAATHSFELMLFAFILGMSLGGLFVRTFIGKLKNPARALAIVQLLMAVAALSSLPLYNSMFEIMESTISAVERTDAGYLWFNTVRFSIAAAIMAPAAFFAGMTLPLVTSILIGKGHGEKSIGAVYAANTAGAIIGAMASVHLGVPLLGLKGLIMFGATADFFVAVMIARRLGARSLVAGGFGFAAASLLAVFVFVEFDRYKMVSQVFRQEAKVAAADATFVFHKDGKTGTVDAMSRNDGVMFIKINGKTDAGVQMVPGWRPSTDLPTQIMEGSLAALMKPDSTTGAIAGFGSGVSTHIALQSVVTERIDTIEIESAMVEGAKWFMPWNRLAYEDSRSHIHIDDARAFFATQNRKYDFIASLPSNPWVSGVSSLFTTEFYAKTVSHLKDGGIFIQWMQLYHVDLKLVASVVNAVNENFSDYAVYYSNEHDIFITAVKKGKVPQPDINLASPAMRESLRRIGIETNADLAARKLGDKKSMGALFESYNAPVNSDYYPYLDLNADKARFLGKDATMLIKPAKQGAL